MPAAAGAVFRTGAGLDVGGAGLDVGGAGLDVGGAGFDVGGAGFDVGGAGFDLGGAGFDVCGAAGTGTVSTVPGRIAPGSGPMTRRLAAYRAGQPPRTASAAAMPDNVSPAATV
jgi:hypothetical protein